MTAVPDPLKPLSQSKHAIRKRKQRERDRAKKMVAEIELAKKTILHETTPVTADNSGPERFAAVPDVSPNEATPTPAAESQPNDDAHGTAASDGAAQQPGTTQQQSNTTPEEAKMFGQALVWYFQLGTGALLAKDPRAQQVAGAFLSGIPRPPGAPPLTPDQAMTALCTFIASCGERVAVKYNLRIPYLDEAVVVATIGFSTWGLVYNPEKKRAKEAKDANPKPATQADAAKPDASNTNGAAKQPADPNEVPITPGPAVNLDAEIMS